MAYIMVAHVLCLARAKTSVSTFEAFRASAQQTPWHLIRHLATSYARFLLGQYTVEHKTGHTLREHHHAALMIADRAKIIVLAA